MAQKFSYDFVAKFFFDAGCELLEKSYIDCGTPMAYVCICGQKSKIAFSKFQGGQRCKQCGIKKRVASFTGFKHSEENLKKLAERNRIRNQSLEHRQKIAEANHKRVWTEAQCTKRSKMSQGKKNPFYGKEHSPETKQKLRESHIGLLAREKHPKWNPKITEKERQLSRKTEGYREWRFSVFKRDDFSCQVCRDASGSNLNAHHLESYDINKELRLQVSNGITMCSICHMAFHRMFGKGRNNRKQFDQFLSNNERRILCQLS